MKEARMRRCEAESKRERIRKVLEKQPDLETDAVCLRFACGPTFVNSIRREVKGERHARQI